MTIYSSLIRFDIGKLMIQRKGVREFLPVFLSGAARDASQNLFSDYIIAFFISIFNCVSCGRVL